MNGAVKLLSTVGVCLAVLAAEVAAGQDMYSRDFTENQPISDN